MLAWRPTRPPFRSGLALGSSCAPRPSWSETLVLAPRRLRSGKPRLPPPSASRLLVPLPSLPLRGPPFLEKKVDEKTRYWRQGPPSPPASFPSLPRPWSVPRWRTALRGPQVGCEAGIFRSPSIFHHFIHRIHPHLLHPRPTFCPHFPKINPHHAPNPILPPYFFHHTTPCTHILSTCRPVLLPVHFWLCCEALVTLLCCPLGTNSQFPQPLLLRLDLTDHFP